MYQITTNFIVIATATIAIVLLPKINFNAHQILINSNNSETFRNCQLQYPEESYMYMWVFQCTTILNNSNNSISFRISKNNIQNCQQQHLATATIVIPNSKFVIFTKQNTSRINTTPKYKTLINYLITSEL